MLRLEFIFLYDDMNVRTNCRGMAHKNYVAVRTRYYKHSEYTKQVKKRQKLKGSKNKYETVTVSKKYQSAIAELDHIARAGATTSANVHPEFTRNNMCSGTLNLAT